MRGRFSLFLEGLRRLRRMSGFSSASHKSFPLRAPGEVVGMNGLNRLKGFNGVTLVMLVMLMVLALLATQAAAQTAQQAALISQVLPNPLGSESGGEAVELYNPVESALDISGWTLATEVSQADVVFPGGTVISAHGHYFVADVGWSTLRDNMTWPGADHEEALGLNNLDSGVALLAN